ncbi:XRE family transcriptional regulator [Flavobacterium silvisoli]|uniref:XRE family transcriptional regulator n=1 Tax=Flavobacterium silvisoli TaxID=2529433 RepID=A0A4Q9Z2I7_9FLAO|nr:helix-turn-helix transcriptional regulator [Flavobacterium silvisoli]TBX70392.1 XRE family transcriptional regulator [Flavobacterium silvisoli]
MKPNPNTLAKLPHMGTFIKNKIQEQNITYAETARRMNIKQSTLNGYFIQETLQTRIIWKLSQALNYNLFTDIIQLLPEELQNTNKTSFQQTIQTQQQEINDLKKEISIYKEILSLKP